jgi:hypothetical protein
MAKAKSSIGPVALGAAPAPGPTSSRSIRLITVPPDICKVFGTNDVRITVSGKAQRLETFELPVSGSANLYADPQDSDLIPLFPEDSTTIGPKVTFTPSAADGTWEITLTDTCDPGTPTSPGEAQTRRLVIYYKYETEFEVYVLVESVEFSIPACSAIGDCPS